MENNNETKLKEIIKAFYDAKFLDDVILIGSWCLTFYKLIFDNFLPQVRTTDIDFYVPNIKKANATNVSSSLKEINYDHIKDLLTNKSKFISPDGFEIEFLAKLNRDNVSTIQIGSSSIFAESLSCVDIFSLNYVECSYYGYSLKVASPSAFVIQKILINEKRGAKKEKDIIAIKYVIDFIAISNKYRKDFNSLYNTLPKKWKNKIMLFAKKENIYLPLNNAYQTINKKL